MVASSTRLLLLVVFIWKFTVFTCAKDSVSYLGKLLNGLKSKDSHENSSSCNNPETAEDLSLFTSLPKSATARIVKSVYDGDTLTLSDGKRVRFLGIDTPEIGEPFSQKAKQYTVSHCRPGSQIFLTFGSEKTDRFERLLATVWVKESHEYFRNVNLGLVQEGLAVVYRSTDFDILKLQKSARERKLGVWEKFRDTFVVKTPYGKAYHKLTCEHIQGNRRLEELKASDALDQGLSPCRTCFGQ